MNKKEAVALRIIELCKERNIATNALANISGVSPSTVYSMLNEKSQNPGVVSIKKLACFLIGSRILISFSIHSKIVPPSSFKGCACLVKL